jgi:integrase
MYSFAFASTSARGGREIIAFWKGCGEIGYPFGPVFKLLAVTGQRREEVAGMRWSELDLVNRTWNIPGARTKNGRPHIVHLSDLAMAIIAEVPRFKPVAGKDFVFSTKGDVSVRGFDYAKNRMVMPADDWTLHDLRRTVTTGMASLGIPPMSPTGFSTTRAALSAVSRLSTIASPTSRNARKPWKHGVAGWRGWCGRKTSGVTWSAWTLRRLWEMWTRWCHAEN